MRSLQVSPWMQSWSYTVKKNDRPLMWHCRRAQKRDQNMPTQEPPYTTEKKAIMHFPSPTRMAMALPLNVGQHSRVAEIVAGIAENGTPSQNLTATGTAKALRKQWNVGEYFSILHGKESMGGSMTVPVAESIVRSMSQVLVKSRADGQTMAVMHPKAVMSSGPVSKPKTKPKTKQGPKPKPVVMLENITEEMVKNREKIDHSDFTNIWHRTKYCMMCTFQSLTTTTVVWP
jgi:hypothetical protein